MRLSILSLAVLSAVLLVGPQCHGPRHIAMAQDPAPSPGPVPTPTPVPVPPAPIKPVASIASTTSTAVPQQGVGFDGTGATVPVGGTILWRVVPSQPFTLVGEEGLKFVVIGTPPYDVVQVVSSIVDNKVVSDIAVSQIVLANPTPPPGPAPTPTPTPTPTPIDPAPITEDGFRVLIIYESSDMTKYSWEQQAILASQDIRDFLNQNCVKEGSTPAYRMFDPDVDLKNESPIWQKAMARPRTEIPWVIISNGKTGFEGPLPKTPTAFLELCKKYLPTK